jgi:hypothetical protein
MRSTIKALTGSLAILLLAIALPRQKKTELTELALPEETETAGTIATGVVSTRSDTQVSAELVERDASSRAPIQGHAAFEAFGQWFDRYENTPVKTAELLEQGERVAVERRAALAELIENDPQQALLLAIPYEQRKVLPSTIARHLEEPVSGYGDFGVIGVAPGYGAPEGNSIERLVTLGERTFKASVYGRRLGQASLQKIPLYGIAIGESLAVAEHPVRVLGATEAADRLAGLPASAAECPISQKPGNTAYAAEVGGVARYFCHDGHIEALTRQLEEAESGTLNRQSLYKANESWTQGAKSLLFIRVNFPDDPAETITVKAAADLMAKTDEFFRLNSYGKLSVSSTITPLLTLPNNKASYRASTVEINFKRVVDDARAVAAAAGFGTANYDLDCVHLNGAVVSARGYIGQKGATLADQRVAAACHELGHNLGLYHANGWSTSDSSIVGQGHTAEYKNVFDTMGDSSAIAHQYNACYKNWLNWLPDSAVQTIDQDGFYRLYAFDVPSLEPGRAYALRMLKNSDRDYWIETRQNSTLMTMGDLLFNLSPWYKSLNGTELLDMVPVGWDGFYDAQLKIGRSFYDPELGVKIIPLTRTGTTPDSVDILVKHVHYLSASAEATDEGANFNVTVAEPGQYSVWCRTLGPYGTIAITADGNTIAPASLESKGGTDWIWSRIIDNSGKPALLSLTVGQHDLHITGDFQIDSIVVTDDPTIELPPVLSTIPDQTTTVGKPIFVECSVLVPGRGSVRLDVSSSNEGVVTRDSIVVDEQGSTERIWITPASQQLGATKVTLTATTPDGRSATTSFNLIVIGDVQAAVDLAPLGDTLRLPAGSFVDHVVIRRDLTLEGASTSETIIDAGGSGVGLTILSNAVVTIKNLTIRNGQGGIRNSGVVYLLECAIDQNIGASRGGGGIWNGPDAVMTIERCTISANRCNFLGGGIYNAGSLQIVNSTISGNRSVSADGGGILNSGVCVAIHSTVAFNRARAGGGIANRGLMSLGNSIISNNSTDAENNADLKGDFISRGYILVNRTDGFTLSGDLTGNILGEDPRLAPLHDNGGPTMTHALASDSPAIDSGIADGLAFDQRGSARLLDSPTVPNAADGADIGAFEFVPDSSEIGDLNGGTVSPRLILGVYDGEIVVSLDRTSQSAWLIEASPDFITWERVGVLRPDQTNIRDASAYQVARRFYRAIRY